MTLPIYQVDAFSDAVFSGNPAAVVPLQQWLDDDTLQRIAQENNLSETAFYVASSDFYELRWFTPTVEVDLCGHATLAAAHVLYEHEGCARPSITFSTKSGLLKVSRGERGLTLDFPVKPMQAADVDATICAALGAVASEAYRPSDSDWPLLYVYATELEIAQLAPDFSALASATNMPIIGTAPGDQHDFVSRFFAPQYGVDEDPVTGSAHCCLVPYWEQRLGRSVLRARQISQRGGELLCELADGRVCMTGQATTFLTGQILRY